MNKKWLVAFVAFLLPMAAISQINMFSDPMIIAAGYERRSPPVGGAKNGRKRIISLKFTELFVPNTNGVLRWNKPFSCAIARLSVLAMCIPLLPTKLKWTCPKKRYENA